MKTDFVTLIIVFWLILSVLPAQAATPGQQTDHPRQNSEHQNEYGDADASEDTVHLTPEQLSLLDIITVVAAPGRADQIVSAPVEIEFVPAQVAAIGPLLSAKVDRVLVDLGERVARGQTIARLVSVELAERRSKLQTLKANKAMAEAEYRREKSLQSQGISSEEVFLAAKARFLSTEAKLNAVREELRVYGEVNKAASADNPQSGVAQYDLKSPIAGVLEQRDVVAGQTLSAMDTPFLVVNNQSVWAMLHVAEGSVSRIATGNVVKVRVNSYPQAVFAGTLTWVSRRVDKTSRTILARAEVDTPDGRLKPGMFGTAQVSTDARNARPLVPSDAVQTVGDRDVVFVPGEASGEFRAVLVTAGTQANGWIEIEQGIAPGQLVVSQGAFDLMSALTSTSRSASHDH